MADKIESDDAELQSAPVGNIKVSREDWIAVAMDVLVSQGVERVKVLTLGERLGVSRSSFYWYFKSRQHLLGELLAAWERTNTQAVVDHADQSAKSITGAVCNLFRCFLNPDSFNYQLDFAVREWARRSGSVRRIVDQSDETRLNAIREMFERFGYEKSDAVTRARILYYMQIGYYALELHEPLERRLSFVPGYLRGFTGEEPLPEEIAALAAFARRKNRGGEQ